MPRSSNLAIIYRVDARGNNELSATHGHTPNLRGVARE